MVHGNGWIGEIKNWGVEETKGVGETARRRGRAEEGGINWGKNSTRPESLRNLKNTHFFK